MKKKRFSRKAAESAQGRAARWGHLALPGSGVSDVLGSK